MSDEINSHKNSRMRVCGVCFRKPKHFQIISPVILQLIKDIFYNNYSLDDNSLPLICCTSCVNALKAIHSGKSNRKLPEFDYGSLVIPRSTINTRSKVVEICYCTICKIAKLYGLDAYQNMKSKKAGRPSQTCKKIPTKIKRCSLCHSDLGKGKSHVGTKNTAQENFVDMIVKQTEKTQKKVTSKMLNTILIDKKLSGRGCSVSLATDGPPKQLIVGKIGQ